MKQRSRRNQRRKSHHNDGQGRLVGLVVRLRWLIIILLIAAIIGGGVWAFRSGWVSRQIEAMAAAIVDKTRHANLEVGEITVTGRFHTDQKDLLTALGVHQGSPILGFSPTAAAEKISKLPWVGAVTVTRKLPDTIAVQITERKPLAIWQHGARTVLIDTNGKEIVGVSPTDAPFSKLPLMVGAGAAEHASDILTQTRDFAAIFPLIQAYTMVSERRWNLYLRHALRPQQGLLVKLPEEGLAQALTRLEKLIKTEQLLERNIVSIDLRLPDRHVLQVGGEEKE